jgi:drug/metabolite transporter (DMT)-like permease
MTPVISGPTWWRRWAASEAFGWALLLSCVVIWGANAVAFKVALRPESVGQPGPGLDAAMLNGCRFLLVAPLMAGVVAVAKPSALRLPARDIPRFVLYGFVAIAGGETLLTQALQYTAVANMALLGPGTMSLWAALWAAVFGEQALTKLGWLGALVAFAGVALVAGSAAGGFRFDGVSWIGDLMALSRAAVHACYLVFLTRAMRTRSAFTATLWNIVFGALWLVPYVVWKAPSVPWGELPSAVWWALAWTVLPTTVFGYAAWNWTMSRVGAVAASKVMFLIPPASAACAWLLLGESMQVGQIAGAVVIVAGIALLRRGALPGARA